MPITDDMVSTVRAYLTGDSEKFQRLNAQLDRSPSATRAYLALVTAAFVEAVEHRFTAQTPVSEVIDYVANVRSRSDGVSENLDPTAAERMIRVVFHDDVDAKGYDSKTTLGVKMLIASAIMSDEDFDSAELEAFMDRSRELATEILG